MPEPSPPPPRPEPQTWLQWTLLLAAVAVPVVVSAVTAEVSFSRAKEVEFCASCHVMGPHVTDVTDPKSDGLAARHFQNRWINDQHCYTCHMDYDFLGPVTNKIRGMRHTAAFYLGKEGPLKLYKPFPNSSCLRCHTGAKGFESQEAHAGVKEELLSGAMSCTECHGPMHPGARK